LVLFGSKSFGQPKPVEALMF